MVTSARYLGSSRLIRSGLFTTRPLFGFGTAVLHSAIGIPPFHISNEGSNTYNALRRQLQPDLTLDRPVLPQACSIDALPFQPGSSCALKRLVHHPTSFHIASAPALRNGPRVWSTQARAGGLRRRKQQMSSRGRGFAHASVLLCAIERPPFIGPIATFDLVGRSCSSTLPTRVLQAWNGAWRALQGSR